MPAGFERGFEIESSDESAGPRFEQRGRFESRLEPAHCDLLPWADPYIASLVEALHAATEAALPQGWPRGAALERGSAPASRSRDQRWPDRFRPEGKRSP